jgi:type II secretory pathway component PulL
MGNGSFMRWVIRGLIIVIFLVAMVITANRLMEWNQLQKEKEALEQQMDEAGEE